MGEIFYCDTCDVSFSSWVKWKEHLMSRKHRDNIMDPMNRTEQLLTRMAKRLKENEGKLNGSD